MILHKDHAKCVDSFKKSKEFVREFPESGKVNGHCKWPSYHANLSDLKTHGKYRNVKITKSFEEKTIATRLSRQENALKITKDATVIAETEIISLANRLYVDLSSGIFEKETVEKIELIKNICDLKSISDKVLEKGSVLVGILTADVFIKSAK